MERVVQPAEVVESAHALERAQNLVRDPGRRRGIQPGAEILGHDLDHLGRGLRLGSEKPRGGDETNPAVRIGHGRSERRSGDLERRRCELFGGPTAQLDVDGCVSKIAISSSAPAPLPIAPRPCTQT
jgi:hypothetical protein